MDSHDDQPADFPKFPTKSSDQLIFCDLLQAPKNWGFWKLGFLILIMGFQY